MTATTALLSPSSLGLVRVAAASPASRVADVAHNTQAIIAAMRAARDKGCALVVFPELAVTSYSCGDLFRQTRLLEAAEAALLEIARASGETGIVAAVGLPLRQDGRLFNCAALVGAGAVLGVAPKTYPPNYSEFYERRWFAPAAFAVGDLIQIGDQVAPFGVDLIFRASNEVGCVIAMEICEDLWAVKPPSLGYAAAGATILLNGSASPDQLSKADYRRELVKQQSARCLAAYLYAGAGPGESTTDVVYGGHSLVCENGVDLSETERFEFDTQLAIADLDLQRLSHERLINSTFLNTPSDHALRTIAFHLPDTRLEDALLRPLSRTPFVPGDPAQRAKHCREIFAIQSTGLARRMLHTGSKRVTLGISGGLDSTLALLVVARAFDKIGLPREGITAVTMPGFGTTDRTYRNALALMHALGTTPREIPIRDAVLQHFRDIGHDPDVHDVTYENAQARERTQILMDLANKHGGFVVGTGDLSELALGWATFNGDHMSMYHVNAGVPKTLVRYLIEWSADEVFSGDVSRVLRDIAATPITPELLPLKDGQLQQRTEDAIGPYVLHDFFLFCHVRYGYPPRKVFFLARQAFGGATGGFDDVSIVRWLGVFYSRFFSQQFKRSAMPDGPKVGSVALSPRGDWRMPSDARADLWREELDEVRRAIGL